ncbi:Putative zinc-finger [Micromonospora pattaloongensis]|uniref:Zinc-finger n=1 Tax=Micromonospora pattaloongensis TaxID=405436 RepID=A0A1H3K2U9_9ACTN|nr:zf-HC2 domain-containing protein [Micromonospora pattaloongensis]SDY45844.1 Putative zinc-finger [Micromonospora pattaloongensis]
MSRAQHWDVGAYALGVLDEADAERFEEHLASCWACAAELESMLPVVELLSDVDIDELQEAEPAGPDRHMLDRMIRVVGEDRRHARSRRVLAIAAGVVAAAMISGASLFAGSQWFGEAPANVTAQPEPTAPSARPPAWPNGLNIGGPELAVPEGAEQFTGIDKSSGVRADLVLEAAAWGTQMSFALSKLPGPLQCRLVVIRASGTAEVLSSWSVPAAGYGTDQQPMPLLLQAATAAPRDDIDRVQVQAVDEQGVARALVTVPV